MSLDCALACARRCAETGRDSVQWYRTVSVVIRTRTWTGYAMGIAPKTDSDTTITVKPRVRQVTAREVAASGGLFTLEDVRVGPITPDYTCGTDTGGHLADDLDPEGDPKVEILYLLSGDIEGTYRLIRSDFTKPMGYFLWLRNSASSPRRTP